MVAGCWSRVEVSRRRPDTDTVRREVISVSVCRKLKLISVGGSVVSSEGCTEGFIEEFFEGFSEGFSVKAILG